MFKVKFRGLERGVGELGPSVCHLITRSTMTLILLLEKLAVSTAVASTVTVAQNAMRVPFWNSINSEKKKSIESKALFTRKENF